MIGILITTGTLMIVSFYLGFYLGSKNSENKEIVLPNINIHKKIKEKKVKRYDNKKREKELEITEINLENIDNYDGSSLGQKDFPN